MNTERKKVNEVIGSMKNPLNKRFIRIKRRLE